MGDPLLEGQLTQSYLCLKMVLKGHWTFPQKDPLPSQNQRQMIPNQQTAMEMVLKSEAGANNLNIPQESKSKLEGGNIGKDISKTN